MNEVVDRIRRAAEVILECNIHVLHRSEWESSVRAGGEPTVLPRPLSPFERVGAGAEVERYAMSARPFAATGGFHVLRRDDRDAPTVFNRDSYSEVDPLRHPEWSRMLSAAAVQPGPDLDEVIRQHVFLRGPERWPDHHSAEVPPDIMRAKPR